ncbi:MAG: amidase [SAR202 cluster bacterium]|nr:amidase [SAR202 cluster bacterium]
MPSIDAVLDLDSTAQAELVRKKQVKPIELVEGTIKRIEKVNPKINSVVIEMYDHAREMAKGPVPSGPFGGAPFLLKNFLAEYAGTRFTESVSVLKDYVSTVDTELVKRYKRSGVITVAKTNIPSMALGVTTEPVMYGPTRNPWDVTRIAGGSSGGAAAAVAAGLAPMAHGNDAGGSIRIPAACCGVYGMKPSRGRNPLGPAFGDLFSGMVAEHVLTRSVRDSAIMLDATHGPDVGDPYQVLPPSRPFAKEVGADPGELRIGFSATTPLGTPMHADNVAAVRDVAKLCADLGHNVEEAMPKYDYEGYWKSFTSMLAGGFAWAVDGLEKRTGKPLKKGDFEPFLWAMLERGRKINAPEYLRYVEDVQRGSREIGQFFKKYDIWLMPTVGTPPPPLGTFKYTEGEDPFELRRRMAHFSPFTYITNGTGQPSVSIPLYWNAQNLPIGLLLAARMGDEATLFRLSGQLEQARPWAGRKPPVWGGE